MPSRCMTVDTLIDVGTSSHECSSTLVDSALGVFRQNIVSDDKSIKLERKFNSYRAELG